LAVTSGGRGVFKNLNDGIYLGTYDLASEGAYPGFIIRSTAAASGSQIVGYKYGSYLPIYLNADAASRGKVFIGYSSTETNSDTSAQLNLKDTNGTYALDTVGGASFRNGTTRFESANLNFVETYIALDSSSDYPFRPVNDATGEGLAIGRYSNPTSQQLIMSYQGGAGRVIARELTANVPQLRLELDDNLATTELFRGQKTLITLFKNTLVSGSLTTTGGASGSFSGSFRGDGSGLTGISGGSADTGSLLTTASVSLNTITFTKGDASTFNITVDTGSAGGSTFPYSGTAEIDGTLVLTGSLDMNSTVVRTGTSASIAAAYLNLSGDDYAIFGGLTSTNIIGSSLTAINPSQVGNILIQNNTVFGSTKGYTKIDAGNLYLTGSTINSTGTWTHADDLTIQEGVEISGSLGLTGSFTIGRVGGNPDYDLGIYQIATASIQADYLDMDLYESTLIKPTSIGSTQGNFEIRNRALFGGTKGYIKLDAGDLYLTGSTINSTGTWTHASDLTVQGTLTATVDSANTASVVQITADNANASRYVLFSATNTEAESPLADTSLRYNPSTNTLSTELQGNASTATTASHALTALTASYALTAPASDPFPYTGSVGISGSTDIVGNLTVDVASGGAYNNTGSILAGNLEFLGNSSALMRGRVNTEIRGESLYDADPSRPGNITIANTLLYGSTKGYTKIDAGDVIISGSAVYIQTSALPTSEPSNSGQLWLSGSAGNSKYLMVRD
jgi:hypothetical protein